MNEQVKDMVLEQETRVMLETLRLIADRRPLRAYEYLKKNVELLQLTIDISEDEEETA